MDYYEMKAIENKATDIRAARKVFSRVGFFLFRAGSHLCAVANRGQV